MSILPISFQCDICGEKFEKPVDVRDEIAIANGSESRAYCYVCERCIKSVVEVLDKEFPSNKYAMRRKEAQRIAEAVKS